LVLKLLGASWPVAAPFFAVGLLMLLLNARATLQGSSDSDELRRIKRN